MVRRKHGTWLPLEVELLDAALSMRRDGHIEFYGFRIAQTMRGADEGRRLTAHGTLYKALGRLEEQGVLTSRWEDPAAASGRPPRRLYRLTARGLEVAATAGVPGPIGTLGLGGAPA